jgi:hypothetical protein
MANKGTSEFEEGFMNVSAPFVAHSQASQVMQPGEGALHHPATFAQAAAMRRTSFCQQRPDATPPECFSMGLRVISAVALHGLRTPARAASFAIDLWHRIEQRQQLSNVVSVGSGQHNAQRHAPALGQQMMLGACLAAVYRAGAGFFPAPTARTEEESATATDQSSAPCSCKRLKTNWCSLSQTPASCQSRKRRQQVMPEPHSNSCGRYSHGMPVFKTNKMPVKAWRLLIGLRPGYFERRGLGVGRSGSIMIHKLSSNIGLAIAAPRITGATTSMPQNSFC